MSNLLKYLQHPVIMFYPALAHCQIHSPSHRSTPLNSAATVSRWQLSIIDRCGHHVSALDVMPGIGAFVLSSCMDGSIHLCTSILRVDAASSLQSTTVAFLSYFSVVNAPIVSRSANGTGGGVAAQHSQDFAAWYAYCPGLKVVSPYSSEDAKGLLKAAIRADNPVVFMENEVLYSEEFPMSDEAMSPNFLLPMGVAKIKRPGKDVTIVAYSLDIKRAIEAAAQLKGQGIDTEVVNLRTLRPLDFETIKKSVMKTHHLVTIDNGWPFANIGAEVVTQVIESEVFHYLDGSIEQVTGVDVSMPYALPLEVTAQPSSSDVVKMV